MYIVALVRRDWPVGGVARVPDTPEARAVFAAARAAFDVMPAGEVWFYVPYVTPRRAGGEERGVLVCRGYEGRKGPQSEAVLERWCVDHAHGVDEDRRGREVLEFMGEAWVEEDKWANRRKARPEGL
ncbi:hypothetical protein BT67DRAFT_440203 [Trichocladium antarcticum]|uniref:Uncharacterized protein n=1 Tax=Trichocladium antarcticum TaxID=1450529 RepID=A0AAN6UN23_9PEZI|nr:hypothetical protein BT67DRAFT_440203 [Trichocladium antarcticum]